ncbi:MAG: replication protein RepA [Rhodospirillaceae bacterium]
MKSTEATEQKQPVPANQLELSFNDVQPGEELDVSFMHRSFGLSGLPLRQPFAKDTSRHTGTTLPAKDRRAELTKFHRTGASCALTINSMGFTLPGGYEINNIGLPFGAKARLLVLWLTTQARQQSDNNRWLEIGSIKSWLTTVGVPYHSENISAVKEQLVRLSFARFTMMLNRNNLMYFNNDQLIESSVFEEQDLMRYDQGDLVNVRLPVGIKLGENAYNRFTGQEVIYVPTQALSEISNSAMAIDIFLYLCYRLPTLSPSEEILVSWKSLIAQFGNGEAKSKFQQTFLTSIERALKAYERANVEINAEGLLLRYSDPAGRRKMFVLSPASTEKPMTRKRLANRIIPQTENKSNGELPQLEF